MPSAARTLLLITASSPEIQRVRRSRVLNFQQITMPYLAAFAPSHWTVLHVDEGVRPVDFEMPADLVAITFHTPSAPHTYALATRFRERGIPVVLGGPHVTLMPDEAQGYADVIFVIKDTQLVEQGTHDTLMALNGVYAELYKIQTPDEPAAEAVPQPVEKA